jgi:hypothetical protein
LKQAQHHRGIARIFVDLFAAGFALFLQFFQRLPNVASSWKIIDAEMYGMMAEAEDRGLIELRAAERGDLREDFGQAFVGRRRKLVLHDFVSTTGSGIQKPSR